VLVWASLVLALIICAAPWRPTLQHFIPKLSCKSCCRQSTGPASRKRTRDLTCLRDAACHGAGQISGAGNKDLLRLLLQANVPEEVFASKLVRSMVLAKWHTFALPRIKLQAAWFAAYLALFIAYQVRARARCGGGQQRQSSPGLSGRSVSFVDDPSSPAGAGGPDQRPDLEHHGRAVAGRAWLGCSGAGRRVALADCRARLAVRVAAASQPHLRARVVSNMPPWRPPGACVKSAPCAASTAAQTVCRGHVCNRWNVLALLSHSLMPVLFALHLARADAQLFRGLVALEALLLWLRLAFFLHAHRQLGAMVAMFKQVGCLGAQPGARRPALRVRCSCAAAASSATSPGTPSLSPPPPPAPCRSWPRWYGSSQ
jgi:hypothetical protein